VTERLASYWARIRAVVDHAGKPCTLEQAPDTLLFDELKRLVVELVTHLSVRGQCWSWTRKLISVPQVVPPGILVCEFE
jgi:hypothetical protein